MCRYAIERILIVAPVLAGIPIVFISLIHLLLGDPAVTMLDERAIPRVR